MQNRKQGTKTTQINKEKVSRENKGGCFRVFKHMKCDQSDAGIGMKEEKMEVEKEKDLTFERERRKKIRIR